MRIQSKTMLVFRSPLLFAVATAYFKWAVFGLPAIPPGAQPPAHSHFLSVLFWVGNGAVFIVLLLSGNQWKRLAPTSEDREYFGELANI